MTARRTICQEAHERLLVLQESQADPTNLWRRVADHVGQRTGLNVRPETALWVQVELALELDRTQPEDAAHLREAVLYLGVIAELRANDREWLAQHRRAP